VDIGAVLAELDRIEPGDEEGVWQAASTAAALASQGMGFFMPLACSPPINSGSDDS
jgi:hypothetical protein